MWIKDKIVEGVTLRYHQLDGKQVAYHSQTPFLVQIGKGAKGSYRTKYTILGDLARAVMWYNGINIGYGWKKRLLMPSSPKLVLARATS